MIALHKSCTIVTYDTVGTLTFYFRFLTAGYHGAELHRFIYIFLFLDCFENADSINS